VTLGDFLIAHGGALILPLAVIEGPVVSIVTGLLAAQGCFAWYCALILLVCGDLIGDIIYYAVGRTGIRPLGFVCRRVGVYRTPTRALQRELRRNAGRMLVIGKWTHSFGALVLIGGGMLRLPLPRFILINLLATIPKSTVLFGVGYFMGDHYRFLEHHYLLASVVLGTVGIGSILLIIRRTDGIWAPR
jgi:membrane-associated protein